MCDRRGAVPEWTLALSACVTPHSRVGANEFRPLRGLACTGAMIAVPSNIKNFGSDFGVACGKYLAKFCKSECLAAA